MGEYLFFIIADFALIVLGTSWLLYMARLRRHQRDFHVRLITILTAAVSIRELLERAAREIEQATGVRHVSFFVYKDGDHFVSSGHGGYTRPARSDSRQLEEFFQRTKRDSIRLSDLTHETEMRRLLKSYRLDFVMPLVRGERIIGFLFLGPKRTGAISWNDARLIVEIKDELAIAIQNAISIEMVKELNANLQQRVDAATDKLRLSNEQLKGLDHAKDEFLSMASHQLRTPLTSVKGYISMVLEGDGGEVSKQQKQLLTEAFTSSERMVHLINDFLNVSRIQTGKFMIDCHETDLTRVVRQEVSALHTMAEARNLTLKTVVPDHSVILQLDEGKIRQVIMNFIDNALYYARPGTDIVTTLYLTPTEAVVTVKDHGIGVPRAQQHQLFSKFFRADNAKLQRPDGTGVGLFLAKKVVDGHGGKLIFSSKQNEGSTFGFRLKLRGNNANDTDNNHN